MRQQVDPALQQPALAGAAGARAARVIDEDSEFVGDIEDGRSHMDRRRRVRRLKDNRPGDLRGGDALCRGIASDRAEGLRADLRFGQTETDEGSLYGIHHRRRPANVGAMGNDIGHGGDKERRVDVANGAFPCLVGPAHRHREVEIGITLLECRDLLPKDEIVRSPESEDEVHRAWPVRFGQVAGRAHHRRDGNPDADAQDALGAVPGER